MAWFDHVPVDPEKKLTREDVEKFWSHQIKIPNITFHCKVCGKNAEFMMPPDDILCKDHLPEGADIMPFEDYLKLVKQNQEEAKNFLADRVSEIEYGEGLDG